jgi:hypothetical protein
MGTGGSRRRRHELGANEGFEANVIFTEMERSIGTDTCTRIHSDTRTPEYPARPVHAPCNTSFL